MPRFTITGVALVLSLSLLTPANAASPPDGNIPFITSMAAAGAVGGLTTSIAAIVYALDDKPFSKGWSTAAIISAGWAGGMAGSFGYRITQPDSDAGSLIAFFFFAAATIWPTYYTIRSVFVSPLPDPPPPAPVALHDSRDAHDPAPVAFQDPMDALDPTPSSDGAVLLLPVSFRF